MSPIPVWAKPKEALSDGSPANPVHHCTPGNDVTDETDWSYVYFGSYPQTEVTGSDLTSAITGANYDENGDVWVNGTKYRRISKSDADNSLYFGGNTYRYFKWERIRWRVLKNDGKTLFLMADRGLDCKRYNEEDKSITWEDCTLRHWLNNTFYHTAFSSAEQGAVMSQTVVNEDNPDYGTEGGNDTTDNVYLLSIGEVTNPSLGFCKQYMLFSKSRQIQASDYSHAMGTYTSSDSSTGGNANCGWHLRSPGGGTLLDAQWQAGKLLDAQWRTGNLASEVIDGFVYMNGSDVNVSEVSVVPVLHVTATAAELIKNETAEVVQEVISGKWGNMPERKRRLEAAGYNYAEVQAKVNALINESK